MAHRRARRRQIEAEYAARLAEARSDTGRDARALGVLQEQREAARGAQRAAVRLADLARSSTLAGALDPLVAADRQDDAFRARLRALAVEASYAELQVALSLCSGTTVR